jgi:hypothetical protein
MSVFKEAYARISVRMFGFRLMVLMQACAVEDGH